MYTFYFQALYNTYKLKLVATKGKLPPISLGLGTYYDPDDVTEMVLQGYRVVIQPAKQEAEDLADLGKRLFSTGALAGRFEDTEELRVASGYRVAKFDDRNAESAKQSFGHITGDWTYPNCWMCHKQIAELNGKSYEFGEGIKPHDCPVGNCHADYCQEDFGHSAGRESIPEPDPWSETATSGQVGLPKSNPENLDKSAYNANPGIGTFLPITSIAPGTPATASAAVPWRSDLKPWQPEDGIIQDGKKIETPVPAKGLPGLAYLTIPPDDVPPNPWNIIGKPVTIPAKPTDQETRAYSELRELRTGPIHTIPADEYLQWKEEQALKDANALSEAGKKVLTDAWHAEPSWWQMLKNWVRTDF